MFTQLKTQRSMRLIAAIALLVVWISIWAVASAQSYPPVNGAVADNTGRLNASDINKSAQELKDLGVKPLAVLSSGMFGASNIDEFGHNAVANYGFVGSNGVVDPNLLAIVVTLNPRQLTVIWGDNLGTLMADKGEGTRIRTQYMAPALSAGNYTAAFTSSFQEAATQINLVRNPPTPTPVPTQVPSVITNVDTGAIGSALLWIAAAVIALIILAVLIPIVIRTIRRNQEAAARRRALQAQFAQARAAAADMITDLEFPVDPNEQIQFRFLALAVEKERPDQLADLKTQYAQMYKRVSDALTRYNALNSKTPQTEEELTAAIQGYQYVQSEVRDAGAFLKHVADLSDQVEQQVAAAPEEVDQAKKNVGRSDQ